MRQSNHQPTRREVLAMSLAAGVACLLPENVLALPNTPQTAKWTRHEVNTTKGQEALEIFKDAVEKMLKLPLDDPRNWYRQAQSLCWTARTVTGGSSTGTARSSAISSRSAAR
jgi:hypothetical protein